MTREDVERIFSDKIDGDKIETGKKRSVAIESFLEVAGFENAPDGPTKEELLDFANENNVGYQKLIEEGEYE